MAYKCPKCGEKIHRGYSESAQKTAGLVGILFYMAFGAFVCKNCGKIARSEFSAADKTKMTVGSIIMIILALVIGVFIFMLILEK